MKAPLREIQVNLLPEEVERANAWGDRLFERAKQSSFDGHGSDPAKRQRFHRLGARCELAFSVATGLPWNTDIDGFRDPDVGKWGVRGSSSDKVGLRIWA